MTDGRTPQIRAFLDRVSDRITAERYADVSHYLREEEWQLAVDMLGEYLAERDAKLDASEWTEFSELATSVRLDPEQFKYIRAQSP